MKKKAAVGQSPSLSKQRDAAPAQLTRVPISQRTSPTVHEWLVSTMAFQVPQMQPAPQVAPPPPVVVPHAELVPVTEVQPPAAAQQAGLAFPHMPPSRPFQTLQEVDPRLAKMVEEEQAAKQAKAVRKRMRKEKEAEFEKVV